MGIAPEKEEICTPIETGLSDMDIAKYSVALELVKYEGQLLWQIFGAFLIAHTVFLSFLLQSLLTTPLTGQYQPSRFIAALVGLFLCIPWASSYFRSSDYYIFRMAQARDAEPPGWGFIGVRGEQFSKGLPVEIAGVEYRINWFSRVLRTKRAVPLIILTFAFIYLYILLQTGPWK
ncbi:hypothetical protein [Thermococcus sp.]|uniref:hypothetical protein n=1 Tax=Thermococcus sp. TaxID=35749 RepID=UPI0026205671|nr:hypothetical protein [Thermococcus sp.]